MSDTTQTANIEEDAMQLTQIFSKAANAIVEASNLRKEVAAMHEQINALSRNVDELRASNDRLVEELSAIRQEKLQVQNELWDAQHQISVLKQQLEQATKLNADLSTEVANLKSEYTKEVTAHEETIRLWHEADSLVTALRAHISAIQEAHQHLAKAGEAFGEVVFPKQEVKEAPAPKEEEVKSEVPFQHQEHSGLGTEQPRDELNRFEPMPMAAKDFEF